MKIDDKLIEWITSKSEIHLEHVKKKIYDEISLNNLDLEINHLKRQIDKIKDIVKIF